MSPLAAPQAATEPVQTATMQAALAPTPATRPAPQPAKRELRLVQAAYSGGSGGVTGVVVFADEAGRDF